jgi:hypothetical protein
MSGDECASVLESPNDSSITLGKVLDMKFLD